MTGPSTEMAKPTVTEVTPEFAAGARGYFAPDSVDLGGKHNLTAAVIEILVDSIQEALRDNAAKTHLIEWQGSKIPRGASVNGIEIGWTQNGMVVGVNGENLGTYQRLVEFGGESGREHKMLVYSNPSTPGA